MFGELVQNLSDYNHGHEFIQSDYVSTERKDALKNGDALTEEEKLSLRKFLVTDLVHDKITEARWFEVKVGKETVGAVFYGTNHPLVGFDFEFLGIFKDHKAVTKCMMEFGEPIDPSNYY